MPENIVVGAVVLLMLFFGIFIGWGLRDMWNWWKSQFRSVGPPAEQIDPDHDD